MAGTRLVQRNFQLPEDLAEWLRERAFTTRQSQTAIVRDALQRVRDSEPAGDEADARARRMALVRRFATGDGVDLKLLRDADRRIWGLDP